MDNDDTRRPPPSIPRKTAETLTKLLDPRQRPSEALSTKRNRLRRVVDLLRGVGLYSSDMLRDSEGRDVIALATTGLREDEQSTSVVTALLVLHSAVAAAYTAGRFVVDDSVQGGRRRATRRKRRTRRR